MSRGRGHDADNARAGGYQGSGHGVWTVSQLHNRGLHASAATRAPYRSQRETPTN